MRPIRRDRFLVATVMAMTASLHAGSLSWDGNGSTTPNPNGGAGNWDVGSTANWWNGAANVVWPAPGGTDDDAVFANTAGTVTLTSAITANDLTFNTTGYLLQNNTLTLNGTTPTITTATGVSATISSVVAGALGLVKSGSGTLTLAGGNTYTGTTTLSAGTLALSGGDNRLATTGTVNFSAAGTLDVGSTSQSLVKLTVTDNLTGTVKGTGATLTLTGAAFALGGTGNGTTQTLELSGLGNFNYTNAGSTFQVSGLYVNASSNNNSFGVLTLAATNTITAAAMNVGAPGNSGQATAKYQKGTVTLGRQNTINANTLNVGTGSKAWGIMQFPPSLGGTPSLTLRSAAGGATRATMNVGSNGSGSNGFTTVVDLTTGYAGGTTLDAMLGTLMIGYANRTVSSSAVGATATFTMGGGTLDATNIILAADSALDASGGYATGTFDLGVTGGAPGGTVKVATLKLGDRLGAGVITSVFNLNHGGTLAAQSILPGTGTAIRTLNWNDGTIKNYDAATDLAIPGGLTRCELLGAGLHAFEIDSGRLGTVSQLISGAGSLTKLGAGKLALTESNTYTGDTTVLAGTLSLGSACLDDYSAVSIATGATLELTHGTTDTVFALFFNGVLQAPGTYNAANSGGRITGTGSLLVNSSLITVASGTTLSPGLTNRTTLTVGALTVQAGGTVAVDVDAATGLSDHLIVAGLVTYAGTLLINQPAVPLTGGESFQIFTAGSSSGTFDAIAGSPGPGLCRIFDPATGRLRVGDPSEPAAIDALPTFECHVSPTGSDANPGTAVAPYATLAKACTQVRAARTAGNRGLAVVWTHGGDYDYSGGASFSLGNSDVNTVYRAVPGEPPPRLIGGIVLNPAAFTPVTSSSPVWSRVDAAARGNLLEVNLAALGITDYGSLGDRGFNQTTTAQAMELFVDEEAMQLGRYPNGDTFDHVATSVSTKSFKYAGTRPERWTQAEQVWFQGFWGNDYADAVRAAAGIDTATKTVTLTSDPTTYGIKAGQHYFAFNLLEEIDTPGEYYINRSTGMLYFWPKGDLTGKRIMLSKRTGMWNALVSIDGASDITFEGFTFECSRGYLVRILGTSANILIRDSKLMNSGLNAGTIDTTVSSGTTGRHNGFYRCEMKNLGTMGVVLNGGNRALLQGSGNFVEQCRIQNFSRLGLTYNPAIQMGGIGIRVRHNEIFNAPHMGIKISGSEMLFEYNEMHDVIRWSGDMGAIYGGGSWVSRGNQIRYNHIHDVVSLEADKDNAIYIDMAGAGWTIFGNVLNRIGERACMAGGGRDNHWENNLILNAGIGLKADTVGVTYIGPAPTFSWDFLAGIKAVNYQSPPWSTAYPELAVIPNDYALWTNATKSPGGCIFSRNVLWNNAANYLEENSAFSYYAEKKDNLESQNAAYGALLFVDPAHDDYTLRPDSPAFSLPGFIDLPFRAMGREKISVRHWPMYDDGAIGQTTVAAYVHVPAGSTDARFYYGPTDGGSDPAKWAFSTAARTITTDGLVTARIDLFGSENYVGRWMVTNAGTGTQWSDGTLAVHSDGSGINPVKVAGAGFVGGGFCLNCGGLDRQTRYELMRSTDLVNFTPVAGTASIPPAATATFTDSAPPPGKGFYQLRIVP